MIVYDKRGGYYGGFALVILKNKYGVIDINNNEIVPYIYNNMFDAELMLKKYQLNLNRIQKLKSVI